ncbi:HAMP domain-containing sensor histidine kinase [Psychrobacter sp.]|uniref:sensor histidine kinase n=1 Tax=Psychrobacter sp. TaxID=56811 RepID=UPI0025F01870|nr:HAMP domain-containing sensor histidine kinase [Psychrobacter sp.]
MNKPAFPNVLSRRIHQPITLFWRLFLSMLAILLLTSALSVGIERWINTKEISKRMEQQVARLLIIRQDVETALHNDDLEAVRKIYKDNKGLKPQIRIIDEQGTVILPKFDRFHPENDKNNRHRTQTPSEFEHPSKFDPIQAPQPSSWFDKDSSLVSPLSKQPSQQVSADISNYPELADTKVVSDSSKTYIIQLQPKLSLHDLESLRRGHTLVRVLLILVFSILVCYWLSRALIERIHRVQKAVHLMSEGSFDAGETLKDLGNDELGLLAKDVSKLSTRLANSEMARKQMLSDISHELRSPLARLEVATELTRDFAPEAGDYLDRIEKESSRMNELIEHIIQIQSLQMRHNTLDIEAHQLVNLYTLLEEIKQDVCFEFYDKAVKWQWSNDLIPLKAQDSVYKLMGDPKQLHSALENIIRNAFTHTTPDSSVIIDIQQFIHPEKQQPYLKVRIIDAGSGVAETDLQRIFHPFVRLSASRERLHQTKADLHSDKKSRSTTKVSGHGLGLAIAHAIVTAHQGELIAYNRTDGQSGLIVETILPTHL